MWAPESEMTSSEKALIIAILPRYNEIARKEPKEMCSSKFSLMNKLVLCVPLLTHKIREYHLFVWTVDTVSGLSARPRIRTDTTIGTNSVNLFCMCFRVSFHSYSKQGDKGTYGAPSKTLPPFRRVAIVVEIILALKRLPWKHREWVVRIWCLFFSFKPTSLAEAGNW